MEQMEYTEQPVGVEQAGHRGGELDETLSHRVKPEGRGVQVPDVLVDVIDPSTHEWLERMIHELEGKFQ